MTVPRSVVNFRYIYETFLTYRDIVAVPSAMPAASLVGPQDFGHAGGYAGEDLTKCEYVPTALHPLQCNDPYATEGPIENSLTWFTFDL